MRKKKEVEKDFKEDQKIRSDLRDLERKIFIRQRILAILAICSLVLGCMINEMCAGADYDELPLRFPKRIRLVDIQAALFGIFAVFCFREDAGSEKAVWLCFRRTSFFVAVV